MHDFQRLGGIFVEKFTKHVIIMINYIIYNPFVVIYCVKILSYWVVNAKFILFLLSKCIPIQNNHEHQNRQEITLILQFFEDARLHPVQRSICHHFY